MDRVFVVTWTVFENHLLEVGLIQKPGDHGTPDVHTCWFILFYHVWGLASMKSYRNSIQLRVRSHMASHYTWGSLTILHDFGGVLRQPLDTFCWALTISWSQLSAGVGSGPNAPSPPGFTINQSLSQKLGEAPSVIAETSEYPNAPTRTCFGVFKVGFS